MRNIALIAAPLLSQDEAIRVNTRLIFQRVPTSAAKTPKPITTKSQPIINPKLIDVKKEKRKSPAPTPPKKKSIAVAQPQLLWRLLCNKGDEDIVL
jgi:hypothetical protein